RSGRALVTPRAEDDARRRAADESLVPVYGRHRGCRFRVLPAEHWHPRAPGLIPVPMTADAVDVAWREAGVGQRALDRLRGDLLRRAARGLRVVGLADPDDRPPARDV